MESLSSGRGSPTSNYDAIIASEQKQKIADNNFQIIHGLDKLKQSFDQIETINLKKLEGLPYPQQLQVKEGLEQIKQSYGAMQGVVHPNQTAIKPVDNIVITDSLEAIKESYDKIQGAYGENADSIDF